MSWLNNLIVRIKGDSSHLDNTLGKIQSSVGGWAKRVAGFIAAAFGIGALVKFAKVTTELYDVQAKAEQSLLVALKGREDIQQALIKQAGELQKKTLFGDEQSIAAASRLAMIIGQNQDALQKLLPLVADLAQAKFEGNIVTAADMVAKSVGSSTNALASYGITIEGAVGSSKRLESAIYGLNKQVGGQAAAAAKVGTGSITQLKNAWSDLQEVIGGVIVKNEKFQKFISTLTEALYKLNAAAAGYAGMSREDLLREQASLQEKILGYEADMKAQDAMAGKKSTEEEEKTLKLKKKSTEEEEKTTELKWYQFQKQKDLKFQVQATWENYVKTKNELAEIRKLLDTKPAPGSIGDLITREKAFTAPLQIGAMPSAAGAKKAAMAGKKSTDEFNKFWETKDQLRGFNVVLEREMTKMEEILTSARDMAMELGFQVVEALGEALAGGNMKDIGRNLLMTLANFLSQFGRMLIVFGLGLKALVQSQATMNPIAAIVAGTAMLITAGAIRGLMSRQAAGAGGGGGTGYGAGTGVPARTSTTPQTITVKVEGELRGRDIYWSGKRYAQEYGNGT